MTHPEFHHVGVIGAGAMGHGIAQISAMGGYEVTLYDADPAQAREAMERIRNNLDKGVHKRKVEPDVRAATLARLRAARYKLEAVENADLVIEAIPERMELKTALFNELDNLAPAQAVLATNTSSLSISEIAKATERAGSVIGLHFFNPVHIMRLLEVVRGEETLDETVEAALGFAHAVGKDPIVVTDTPGFASSRLGVVLGLEAMRMLESGVASAADIDKAMELGYNHPMGPLRLTDLVGLDVRLGIAEYLHGTLGGEQYSPPEILRRMVDDGLLGKKSGSGFYEWKN
ncbi:MAG TPA: 3-hydroxyacyl-CoA dehydrogenase family protein [Longimicrobiaceae bacterium]|nr:3-hydroxyacyl-CoA dehydrogenase family protein [Longimicrobiaceae bacterium]